MSLTSDPGSIVNQVLTNINLPHLSNAPLFEEVLRNTLRKTSYIVNTKESGLYNINEMFCFKQMFTIDNTQSFRNVYRKTFDLINLNSGNIAEGATVSFAHDISNLGDAVMIYVSCVTDDPIYFTCIYPNVYLDSTNINFINPAAAIITSAIAIAEYTKV